MSRNHPDSSNRLVNSLFSADSPILDGLVTGDGETANTRFADLALLANLASLHDATCGDPDQLRISLEAEKLGGSKTLIYEDQTPENFGVSSSALLFLLKQREAGNGDAALQQVLNAPRLAKFDSNGPILPAGQRFRQLTDSRRSENPQPALSNLRGGQQALEPLTLTRISRNANPSIAFALTEALSPVLARANPSQALKVTERLATIQLVIDSVKPDIEMMVDAVANSQKRQIGTFMGSVERTIAAAANGLKQIVGIEIIDSERGTNTRFKSGFTHGDDVIGRYPSLNDLDKAVAERNRGTLAVEKAARESLRVHSERPMATGRVGIDVKPFSANSRTTNFAAAAAPFNGSRSGRAESHSDNAGAYASCSGPGIAVSSVTVAEAHFESGGIEVHFEVNP